MQTLAFAVVGIVVLIDGLQNAAAVGYVLFRKPAEYDTALSMWPRQDETIAKAVVQIVAGAILVFGRDAIRRGWSRVRRAPDPGGTDIAD